MQSPTRILILCFASGWNAVCPLSALSQDTPTLAELATEMTLAGQLYKADKFTESANKIKGIQARFNEIAQSSSAGQLGKMKPLYQQLQRAHGMLELEGAELEPLFSWESIAEKTSKAALVQSAKTDATAVRFSTHVAPWLVSACGKCHIENRRGGFSMATFDLLLQGQGGLSVIAPGSARGSRLVDVIESGDMPRGGGKVSAEQLAALKSWIDSGAKLDEGSSGARLVSIASAANSPGAKASPMAAGESTQAEQTGLVQSNGSETVSFSRQIAPILNEQCKGCHIAARQASGGLRMDDFTQLLRGGDSGPVVVNGKAAASLLVRKIKGEAGNRMPAGGRTPLSTEQIELFEKWVSEGATFDGPNPEMNIESLINQAWASNATPAELFERRQQRARAMWSRVSPNDEPSIASDDQFFVLGNVVPEQLQSVLQDLSKAEEQAKRLLRLPAKESLIKGGLVVFVLNSRYDYSEFGRMIENRELPREWLGHWHADPLDVYGVIAAKNAAGDALDSNAAEAVALQVVTGSFVGSFEAVPVWFAEGVARNLVSTSFRRSDDRVRMWQQAMPQAMLKVDNARTLIDGRLDEEAAGLVGLSLGNFMMERSNRRRFDELLKKLQAGASFTDACTFAFAPPEAMLKAWLGR